MALQPQGWVKTAVAMLAAVFLLGLMIFWMAGGLQDTIAPDTLPAGAVYRGLALQVDMRMLPAYEAVAGTVQSEQSFAVSAKIMARVESVHVHAGDSIDKGELLVELDDADLRARLSQARDQRQALQARLQRAKSHYRRTQGLFGKQSATRADLEAAEADYQSLRAQVSAAGERLAEAEHALSYTGIRATFSGKVIDHFVEPGDMAAPGMRLLTVYDPHNLRVAAYVRETLALRLRPGQALQAEIDALRETIDVVIDEIVPAAEPGSRSFLVKARIDGGAALRPGLFARLRIPLGMGRQLLIPIEYTKQVGQLDVVWVVDQGLVARRFVRLGNQQGRRVEVLSGLQAGERLVRPGDVPETGIDPGE